MRRRLLSFLTGLLLIAAIPCGAAPRTVLIGAENDWYPYSGEVMGQPQGMTVDLVRAAFAAVDIQARFDLLPYARCMAQTKAGMLVACFNTTRTAQIEADYLWPVRPMFEERFVIYALKDHPQQASLGVRDLEGQRVAVTRGYEYGSEFDSNDRVQRIVTNHDESNFRMVQLGRARYTLAPEINTRLLFQRHPDLAGQFRVVGQFPSFGLYTAFSRRHADGATMLAAFDEGMRRITANGLARSIQERWRRRAESGGAQP